MSEMVLLGQGREIIEVPRGEWEKHVAQAPQHVEQRLSFMSEQHHQVRYFAVRELPRMGEPIRPEQMAAALKLPSTRVREILDELERNLFFLFRNEQGAVQWAYPVTVELTPHRLTFSTGERLYGA